MFLRCFLSTFLFISIIYFSFGQLYTQEEQGEIIIISERVGKEIDQAERDNFKLFEGIKGFQSAVHIKLADGRYFLKITYLDDKTGEIKTSRTLQSEASIKNRGYYIDNFEEIEARKEEEERGGEIIIISERVGNEIDRDEWDKYKLFQEVKGFQSAVFIKFPDNRFILKIIYQDDQTGELKIDRTQQSKESINNIKYSIDHFGEKQADQDTVYKEPGAAFFLEMTGRMSLNIDFRINKWSRFGLGILYFFERRDEKEVDGFIPNIMYYLLSGEKHSKFEISVGLGVRPIWRKDVTGDFPIAFHSVIGYRYQKKRRPLFRISFAPTYFPDVGFAQYGWIGISLGYSL